MSLPNLNALEAEWAVFMENKAGGRNKWTQDQRWRADNPGELSLLEAYRASGGARPVLNTVTGRRMVFHLDAYLLAKEQPPPSDLLPNLPPGWNGNDPSDPNSFPGFQVIETIPIVNGQPKVPDLITGKNYYVLPQKLEWESLPSAGGGQVRSGLRFVGGNHLVSIGGELAFHSTNPFDDCAGIQRIGGDPGGITYTEGWRIQSVNAFTVSTSQKWIRQYVHWRARIFEDKADKVHGGIGNHPDGVQVWQDGAHLAELFDYRVTGYTWYTGMVCLLQQPKRWRRDKVDLHFGQRVFETQQLGNFMLYLSPGNQMVTCAYDGGSDNWMDLGFWGGCREQLQQAIDSPGWSTKLGYEILRPSTGQKWPSGDPNAFRCQDIGAKQGDQWRCTSNPNITEKWNWGLPVGGEFAPWDRCGVGYVPVGYQT